MSLNPLESGQLFESGRERGGHHRRRRRLSQSPRIGAVIRMARLVTYWAADPRLSQSPRIGAVIRIRKNQHKDRPTNVSIPSNRGSYSNIQSSSRSRATGTVSIPSNRGSYSNPAVEEACRNSAAFMSQSPRIGAVIRILPSSRLPRLKSPRCLNPLESGQLFE